MLLATKLRAGLDGYRPSLLHSQLHGQLQSQLYSQPLQLLVAGIARALLGGAHDSTLTSRSSVFISARTLSTSRWTQDEVCSLVRKSGNPPFPSEMYLVPHVFFLFRLSSP